MCGVKGCPATYGNFESYRRHLYRQHRDYMELESAAQAHDTGNTSASALRGERPTGAAPGHCDVSAAGDEAESGDSNVPHDAYDNVDLLSDDPPMTDAEEHPSCSSSATEATEDFQQQMKKQLFKEFKTTFHEKDVQVRDLAVHNSHLRTAVVNKPLSTALYGVKCESPLASLGSFDITLQLPPDIMHDLLEGSIPHVLREVLRGLISSNVLAYSDFEKVSSFQYGHHDRKNKPEALEKGFVARG
ncbi:hypothetical protein MTO96_022561 [Rhipicephalus appendiculatus]